MIHDNGIELPQSVVCDLLNQQYEEIERLNYRFNDLLYHIGEVGYNNKQCKGCVSYLHDISYCTMYDMEVTGEDIVIRCRERECNESEI